MPVTAKGKEILRGMRKEYGAKKGTSVFYASRNKGTITGVDAEVGYGKAVPGLPACAQAVRDALHKLVQKRFAGDAAARRRGVRTVVRDALKRGLPPAHAIRHAVDAFMPGRDGEPWASSAGLLYNIKDDVGAASTTELPALRSKIGYSINTNNDAHEGFQKLEHSLAHKKGIYDPKGLAAAIGRKKMGKKQFQAKAAAARDRLPARFRAGRK